MRTTQAPPDTLRLLGRVFLAIGAVGALVAAGSFAGLLKDRGTRLAVAGTVVEMEKRCHKGCSYRPVVAYTVGGERFGLVGTVGNSWPLFAVGETVTVLARKGDPREARLDHWSETAFPVAMGAGFGTIFGGIGWLMLRKHARENENHG